MQFCDIGVNLTSSRFTDDIEQVLCDANHAGVASVIITGTSESVSEDAASIVSDSGVQLYSTAGVHPHDADNVSANWLTHIEELLSSTRVVAVGECGLDFNRNFSSKEGQLAVFEAQLQLAKKYQKPVFLHEREAFEEQYALLNALKISHGVAHCFTGTTSQMNAYLDLGLYIGVTGWVCDPKRGLDLQQSITELPLDRLLLETDAPYLLPKTLSKKIRRNEPKYIPEVARVVADIKGIAIEKVAQASYENAQKLFSI